MENLLLFMPFIVSFLILFGGEKPKTKEKESHYDHLIAFFEAVERKEHVIQEGVADVHISVPNNLVRVNISSLFGRKWFLFYNDDLRLFDFELEEDGTICELSNGLHVITDENAHQFQDLLSQFIKGLDSDVPINPKAPSSLEKKIGKLHVSPTLSAPINADDIQDSEVNALLDEIEDIYARVHPQQSVLSVERQHEVKVSMEKEIQQLLHAYVALDDLAKKKHKEKLMSSLHTVKAILHKAQQEIKATHAYTFEKSAEVILQRKE